MDQQVKLVVPNLQQQITFYISKQSILNHHVEALDHPMILLMNMAINYD